ncbi:hypothetical protein ACH5RR_003073 [Cinchona calisaya]|uniref:DUF4283 domain-containing protein n=1 Tax=Cinchona calisaya TaxID=153742 RepID=A0ABD3AUF6_9GENT
MAEELEEIWKKFSLSVDELSGGDIVNEDVQKSISECKKCLLGRIFGQKAINFVGVKNFVNQVWGSPKNLVVIELGPNFFQISFGLESDLVRVLSNRPWIIDNQLLMIQK